MLRWHFRKDDRESTASSTTNNCDREVYSHYLKRAQVGFIHPFVEVYHYCNSNFQLAHSRPCCHSYRWYSAWPLPSLPFQGITRFAPGHCTVWWSFPRSAYVTRHGNVTLDRAHATLRKKESDKARTWAWISCGRWTRLYWNWASKKQPNLHELSRLQASRMVICSQW